MFARAENTSDHLDFTACSRDFLLGSLREAVGANRELLRELTVTEDADAVLNVLQDAALNEDDGIDRRAIFEAVERLNIDLSER